MMLVAWSPSTISRHELELSIVQRRKAPTTNQLYDLGFWEDVKPNQLMDQSRPVTAMHVVNQEVSDVHWADVSVLEATFSEAW